MAAGMSPRNNSRESRVTVGGSMTPFAKTAPKGVTPRTGHKSGQNRDSIRSAKKTALRATPKSVGY